MSYSFAYCIWPSISGRENQQPARFRGSNDSDQAQTSSWIARQRLHLFWESLHLLVAAIGLALSVAIIVNAATGKTEQPVEIRLSSRRKWPSVA